MCNPIYHKSYGLVLTSVTEVRNHVVYIIDNIIVISYIWLYDTLYAREFLMHPPNSKSVFWGGFPFVAANYSI